VCVWEGGEEVLIGSEGLRKYQSLCDYSNVLRGKVLKGFQESSKTRIGSAMLVVTVHNFWYNCRATTGRNVCGVTMPYSSVLILHGYCDLCGVDTRIKVIARLWRVCEYSFACGQ